MERYMGWHGIREDYIMGLRVLAILFFLGSPIMVHAIDLRNEIKVIEKNGEDYEWNFSKMDYGEEEYLFIYY